MSTIIGRQHRTLGFAAAAIWLGLAASTLGNDGKLLLPRRVVSDTPVSPNLVSRRCLTPEGNNHRLIESRGERWSLPDRALAANFDTTIHCLVLRFNFQYEATDDPNTTGRGHMDLSRPLDTLSDSEYIARVGHLTDPPPHDSLFFDAHMRALNRYWETVSGGQIHLTWDIYPPARDSVYELPYPMNHYGRCDFSEVVEGLEDFFVDCIRLADTTSPEIDFSSYQSFFLFHAGSDGQNDIGFPATCADLFSGYIRFAGNVAVDDSTCFIDDGLMMPETAVQDNRATALNAVLAHEFGHQLGLVDMYNTENFLTQLGDFSLMDNNGFGTGIDFGWPIGKVFGAIPLLPDAWSRAFLGIGDIQDFRADTTDVPIVAAELANDPSLKIARLPISEREYYLIENRLDEVDQHTTYVLADQETSVIQGPVDSTRAFTGEYDFLMPGSGVLIYHVDEEVAALDYDGDGQNNFEDNDLQWFRDDRKFVSLVEADGLIDFGGFYRVGYGNQDDFFRDDLTTAFTPNTNPATVDNTGNQTHFFVENIGRMSIPGGHDDRIALFDFDIDRQVPGFPVRAGAPLLPLAPIADDLDGDGVPEVIMAAGRYLSVVTGTGENFIRMKGDCQTCPEVYDSVTTSINRGIPTNPAATYPVPVYALAPALITAGPVTGRVTSVDTEKLIAVGYPDPRFPAFGWLRLYQPRDDDNDARADTLASRRFVGLPTALSFGDSILWALTEVGNVQRWAVADDSMTTFTLPAERLYHGVCRLGDALVVLASDTLSSVSNSSWLYLLDDGIDSVSFEGLYMWGPTAVDMNLDSLIEIAAFSPDGKAILVTIDDSGPTPEFSILSQRSLDRLILTPPTVGDVDLDGYPDVIVGGRNEVIALNADLVFKTGFPLEATDRFPDAHVIAGPIVADIESGGRPELIFPSDRGNFYSYGNSLSYGFPLSSGEQREFVSATPAVLFNDPTGGRLGYLGGDGWFYAWEVDPDTLRNFWPMNGADPAGTFAFDPSKLPTPQLPSTAFDDERFFNYPNPARDGQTTIRYYLGADAQSVRLKIFDLSGRQIAAMSGATRGAADNEVTWDCSGVTAGVYRCVIEVDFGGSTEAAFTDIAVIR
jgi:M6 family metalloprotease-like protein